MKNNLNLFIFKVSFYILIIFEGALAQSFQFEAEIIETTSKCSEKNFTQLMKNGYRRSGKYTYKPICENCSSCVPIRIPVNDFQPNKTQKRTLKRGEKLLTSAKKSLIFNKQEFFLFSKFREVVECFRKSFRCFR